MANNKNKGMPTADEIYKGIRAFNERLRQARIHYGENSTIVKLMKDRAQRMFGLKWTKTMGISKSKKNVERVLQDPFSAYLFRRYIKDNTVENIIKPLIHPDVKKSIDKLPAKNRYQYLEAEITSLKHFHDMYDKIYRDMYDANYSKDECDDIWILNTTKEYDDLVDLYANGTIDLDTYVDEIFNRRYGASGSYTSDDDDDDDDIDYNDFLPPKKG